jgi:hypothetical protein
MCREWKKRELYMNLWTTRLRARPRNRWQDEVREDGRIVGGEGWEETYMTERNGRSSWERQGIVTFCVCQWNRIELISLLTLCYIQLSPQARQPYSLPCTHHLPYERKIPGRKVGEEKRTRTRCFSKDLHPPQLSCRRSSVRAVLKLDPGTLS